MKPVSGPTEDAARLATELIEAIVRCAAERVGEIVAEQHRGSDDGWLRGAKAIADHIGCKPKRVYNLAERTPPAIPVEHEGRYLLARRSELDAWIRDEEKCS